MATTPDIGKLKRSYLMHYIDASFGTGETPKWFLIGRDIEDMSVELNPDTETVKNILDETVVNDNGYEPSIDADTYYANTGDAIYEKIKDIAMNRLTGDDCKTAILEVLVDKKTGAQGGVNIPFNIAFNGDRQQGTATIEKKVPTFTATV